MKSRGVARDDVRRRGTDKSPTGEERSALDLGLLLEDKAL